MIEAKFKVGDVVVSNDKEVFGTPIIAGETYKVLKVYRHYDYWSLELDREVITANDGKASRRGWNQVRFDLVSKSEDTKTVTTKVTTTKVLDYNQATTMMKVLDAFEAFNLALGKIQETNNVEWLEHAEAVITSDGKPYCRVFYADGEAHVEPIASVTKEIEV